MILPPREEHICEIGESKPEPGLIENNCTSFYYNCQMEEGRAIWKYTECSNENFFSPNINNGTCTYECRIKNKNDSCDTRQGLLLPTGQLYLSPILSKKCLNDKHCLKNNVFLVLGNSN